MLRLRRRGAGVVEQDRLLSGCPVKSWTVGSNPTLSAIPALRAGIAASVGFWSAGARPGSGALDANPLLRWLNPLASLVGFGAASRFARGLSERRPLASLAAAA